MERRGFRPDDPVYLLVAQAHDRRRLRLISKKLGDDIEFVQKDRRDCHRSMMFQKLGRIFRSIS
jgi:hypothetical protein